MTEFEKKLLLILEKQNNSLSEIADQLQMLESAIRLLGNKIY